MAKKAGRGRARRASTRTPTKKVAPRARTVAARAASAGGPVSLEEARALAMGRSAAAVAGVVAPQPSPREVGREREKLETEQEQERRRRIREYTATLRIMKARGVKGLGAVAGAAAAAPPLQVFAEGDSWFEYPVPLFGGGIIKRLEKRLGVPVLNLAKAGDEVRFMLGVEERKIIAEQFTTGCPAGGPWDAMLFSGGGNDIVDNPMALWIRDFQAAVPPAQQINMARLDAALGIVRAGYEDLVAMRDDLSPSTHLFLHGYDFAIPDGRGVCHFGPWLQPTFALRGFPANSLTDATAVVKVMLERFAAVLGSLNTGKGPVTLIPTQGTLPPVKASWHNELHPSKMGFDTFADVFHAQLRQAFPGRVL
jgi:hypothetical protein